MNKQTRYASEGRERAVRLVLEPEAEQGREQGPSFGFIAPYFSAIGYETASHDMREAPTRNTDSVKTL